MFNRRGQTILEYTLIVTIFLGCMIAMKDYIKRGFQDRMRSATDDMGDQYDPQYINSNINYSTLVNSDTIVRVTNGTETSPSGQQQSGQWTDRTDQTNSIEITNGITQIGN